ncbi:hypothetical protein [Marivita sp.]|uniref:hypothetical protein n=1 Tax=Marivita sp. TaxID=2003365 RepID=UPI0025BD579F|nr:hypothetical protein [Marivita sp.]
MTQIEELQHRITAALDRVAQGMARMEEKTTAPVSVPALDVAPSADPEEVARLKTALDEERRANAELEERVRELHEAHAAELEAAKAAAAAVDPGTAPDIDVSALDEEVQRLRQANQMLRDTNEEMRGALADNVGEPHLINKAMLAELEALRADRAAEQAETHTIIAALAPLLDQAEQTEEAT